MITNISRLLILYKKCQICFTSVWHLLCLDWIFFRKKDDIKSWESKLKSAKCHYRNQLNVALNFNYQLQCLHHTKAKFNGIHLLNMYVRLTLFILGMRNCHQVNIMTVALNKCQRTLQLKWGCHSVLARDGFGANSCSGCMRASFWGLSLQVNRSIPSFWSFSCSLDGKW